MPLNSDTELILEGTLWVWATRVCTRVMELRKLNRRRRVPRLRLECACRGCSAVLLPLVKRSGRWVVNCSYVCSVLVPLLSFGAYDRD